MRTILVDDDAISRELFSSMCEENPEIELVGIYENPIQAREFVKEHQIELAILDIEMPEINGLDFGRELKQLYPDMVLFYVTAHSKYAVDVFREKADYCIMKPFDRNDIKDAAQRALLLSKRQQWIRAVMFGRFQLFANDEPVHFGNAKAKELLALCLDRRGGEVSMQEAIDKLWPNRPYDERVKRLYRKAAMNLQKTLGDIGADKLFETSRGACHINMREIDCDFYRYLEVGEKELFKGEYLFDYEWGEETLAMLEQEAYHKEWRYKG